LALVRAWMMSRGTTDSGLSTAYRLAMIADEDLARAVEGRPLWRPDGEHAAIYQRPTAARHVKVRRIVQPVRASDRYVVSTIDGGRAVQVLLCGTAMEAGRRPRRDDVHLAGRPGRARVLVASSVAAVWFFARRRAGHGGETVWTRVRALLCPLAGAASIVKRRSNDLEARSPISEPGL
jgi:hypothetical protein